LHIGGQIDILRESLLGIIPKKDKDSLSHFTVKEVIKEHQKIIIFSEHIEHLYSYIAMVLFVSDILIICCLGFTIVAVSIRILFKSTMKSNIYPIGTAVEFV